MNEITELPTGEYDAVRTLRHLLAQAEKGQFNHVLVIANRRKEPTEKIPDGDDAIWATWSDHMTAEHIVWLSTWLSSFLLRRYWGEDET